MEQKEIEEKGSLEDTFLLVNDWVFDKKSSDCGESLVELSGLDSLNIKGIESIWLQVSTDERGQLVETLLEVIDRVASQHVDGLVVPNVEI